MASTNRIRKWHNICSMLTTIMMMTAKVIVSAIPEHIPSTNNCGNVFTLRCHGFTQTCEVASLLIPILKTITLRQSKIKKPQHHTAVECQKREWIPGLCIPRLKNEKWQPMICSLPVGKEQNPDLDKERKLGRNQGIFSITEASKESMSSSVST